MSRIYLGFAVCRHSEEPEGRPLHRKRRRAASMASIWNSILWKPGDEPYVVKPVRRSEPGLSAVTADQ